MVVSGPNWRLVLLAAWLAFRVGTGAAFMLCQAEETKAKASGYPAAIDNPASQVKSKTARHVSIIFLFSFGLDSCRILVQGFPLCYACLRLTKILLLS